jgi:hypothetical protein
MVEGSHASWCWSPAALHPIRRQKTGAVLAFLIKYVILTIKKSDQQFIAAMKCSSSFSLGFVFLLTCLAWSSVPAQPLDLVGVTLLNTLAANLNGAGVRVAQVEADDTSSGEFEVNPGWPQQPGALFEYYSSSGSATSFPNTVGTESAHADYVAQYFYGLAAGAIGVATNVAHVDNYEASDFASTVSILGNYVVNLPPSNINDPVVNQSFIFGGTTVSQEESIDTAYDNYAAEYNTLFVSGVGDGGGVNPPATCYNGLGAGAYGGSTSTGPTPDNGRAKPDLVAPTQNTSLATPVIAGAAALLIQAGLRGDGGGSTAAAASPITLKALLLNGAIKPGDWTNASPSPLDPRYGAGILNVFNSYKQMTGGRHGYSVAASVSTGSAHPPTGVVAAVGALSGWDYDTNSSSPASDGVNHYFFNVTNGNAAATFTATATLVWNRQQNQTAINVLKLFLYNTASSNLIASSLSTVDNVQHLWVPRLPAGQYDLQVWKAGGSYVSSAETYALAFDFFAVQLGIAPSAAGITLSWPVYPAGFAPASATDLLTPESSWNTNYPNPVVNASLNQNQLTLGTTNAAAFFRLMRP